MSENIRKDFTGEVAIKTILLKEGKVLIVRDHKDAATWEFPGGHLEVGETLEDALRREVREELGAEIGIGTLIHSEQVIHKGRGTPHLFIFCTATLCNPEQALMVPSEEIAEVRWVDRESVTGLEFYQECENALKTFWNR